MRQKPILGLKKALPEMIPEECVRVNQQKEIMGEWLDFLVQETTYAKAFVG